MSMKEFGRDIKKEKITSTEEAKNWEDQKLAKSSIELERTQGWGLDEDFLWSDRKSWIKILNESGGMIELSITYFNTEE